MALKDGRELLGIDPLVVEGFIRTDEEALFWWWSFAKGICNISTIDNQVFTAVKP